MHSQNKRKSTAGTTQNKAVTDRENTKFSKQMCFNTTGELCKVMKNTLQTEMCIMQSKCFVHNLFCARQRYQLFVLEEDRETDT